MGWQGVERNHRAGNRATIENVPTDKNEVPAAAGKGRLLVPDEAEAQRELELERDLVERARRGDVAAYEELVRRYQALAFRVAYVILGSAADAEDAAQEGFVRAYHALGRFRPGAHFRPWLVTIVANAARNRRVTAGRHPTLELTAAVDRATGDESPSPETIALAAEQRRELLAAVNRLRADDQRVIACRYFLELSEAETATALGCARGTVKSRLSRALARLREQLAASASDVGLSAEGD